MELRFCLVWLFITHILHTASCDTLPLNFDLLPHPERHALMRRDGPLSLPTYDAHQYYYYISALIGTPAQSIRMTVSTNVADLIVISSADPTCDNDGCSEGGVYNANSSSTYRAQNQNFTFAYGSRLANGTVGTDLLTLGTQNFPATRILLGLASTISVSILGIGSQILEYTQDRYLNLPAEMYHRNLTNIIGYSLYFNHFNASSGGHLLFGGVDTGKFYNKLETLPIATNDGYTNIQMSGIQVFDGVKNNTISGGDFVVLADSASPGCYFPQAVVTQIMSKFNATPEDGGYVYELATVDPDTTLDLLFGSTWISIPIYDLRFVTNATHASLAVLPSFDNITTIGLSFFKNAYTVFDFTNNQISVAALNHDSTDDNVTAISAAGVSGLMAAVQTPTPTSISKGNGSSSNRSTGGLTTGQKAGIAVGVIIGVLLIIIALTIFILRKRRSRNKKPSLPAHESDKKLENMCYTSKAELPATGSKTLVLTSKAELPTSANTLKGATLAPVTFTPSEAWELDAGGNDSVYWFNRTSPPPVRRKELSSNSSSTLKELDSMSTTAASSSGIRRKPVASPKELPATPVIGPHSALNS